MSDYAKAQRAECRTQAELEAAIKAEAWPIVLMGDGAFTVRGSSSVEAWGSSSVEAWGSSSVVARESSSVEAWGSSSVVARESSSVVASAYVPVQRHHAHIGTIAGGVLIAIPKVETVEDWCAYHGVTVESGVAVLYKAVDDKYRSGHGFEYAPGTVSVASDWDGDKRECGGGLHFCASPAEAKSFMLGATKFLACPVALADIRRPRAEDIYPNKVKALGLCGPCYEVDLWRDRVEAAK